MLLTKKQNQLMCNLFICNRCTLTHTTGLLPLHCLLEENKKQGLHSMQDQSW